MADFLSSRGSLLVAGILLLGACVCFLLSRNDADSATRERTTVGVIDGFSGGRGGTYYFEFELDGQKHYDASPVCRTALTPKGCKFGARVLVYYDRSPSLRTKLKEFGEASRDNLATGFWLAVLGLLLIVLHFTARKVIGPDEPDESDQVDTHPPSKNSESLHVVPD